MTGIPKADGLTIIAHTIAALLRDEELRDEVRSFLAAVAPKREPLDPKLLTGAELARVLGISRATLRRLDPPNVIVGDAGSRRFDLRQVKAWLAERDPKPTTPPRRVPDVEVDDVLKNAGLRVMNGAGRHP